MKKQFKFNEVDTDHQCKQCHKPIKKSIIARKEIPVVLCYSCFRLNKIKNPTVTAREARTGTHPGRKKGPYGINI